MIEETKNKARREKAEGFVDKGCASVEFYTPARILVPVRRYFSLMGYNQGIELDPASTENNRTCAERFYTAKTNGLRPWKLHDGPTRVFVNPPYGLALYQWVPHISQEAEAGHQIVALLPGQRFDQVYWQRSLFTARLTAWVLVTKRIAFLTPAGVPVEGNPYGSMLYVFNGRWEAAVEAFAPIGALVEPGRIEQQRADTPLFDGGDS